MLGRIVMISLKTDSSYFDAVISLFGWYFSLWFSTGLFKLYTSSCYFDDNLFHFIAGIAF